MTGTRQVTGRLTALGGMFLASLLAIALVVGVSVGIRDLPIRIEDLLEA